MISPIRQNLFERECDMPLLEARHLALLLLGLDASQPANALPEEHQENYRILHDADQGNQIPRARRYTGGRRVDHILIQDLHPLARHDSTLLFTAPRDALLT